MCNEIWNLSEMTLYKIIKEKQRQFNEIYNKTFMVTAKKDERYSEWMTHQDKNNKDIAKLVQLAEYISLIQIELDRRNT